MSEHEAFERIVASLHEVALDHTRWSRATALIDEALRTHGSAMVFGDGDSADDVRIQFSWVFSRGQRQWECERDYYRLYYPVDERRPRVRHLPDSRLFHITDLLTGEELRTSATYNEMLVRNHCRDGIHVRLDGPNGSRIVWVVSDPVDGNGWSPAQLDAIHRLLPHIRHSVCVQQTLAGAGALGATLAELLEATGVGIIQLDVRGRIVAANDRAGDVLRGGHGLFDEGGYLFARAPHDDADLQGLLTRALPRFGAQGAGGSMIVRRPGALLPLVVHVNPVGRREADVGRWPVAALVLVVDPSSGTGIDAGVVAAALNLTEMESRVAVLLAQGMSVGEIAAATGRKESTIRSHVKHMFTTHGLTRQAELVRLVLSLAGSPQHRR